MRVTPVQGGLICGWRLMGRKPTGTAKALNNLGNASRHMAGLEPISMAVRIPGPV
jgi:hypothetical protein